MPYNPWRPRAARWLCGNWTRQLDALVMVLRHDFFRIPGVHDPRAGDRGHLRPSGMGEHTMTVPQGVARAVQETNVAANESVTFGNLLTKPRSPSTGPSRSGSSTASRPYPPPRPLRVPTSFLGAPTSSPSPVADRSGMAATTKPVADRSPDVARPPPLVDRKAREDLSRPPRRRGVSEMVIGQARPWGAASTLRIHRQFSTRWNGPACFEHRRWGRCSGSGP